MPTYQYHCPECGDDAEQFWSIAETAQCIAPECETCGTQMRRKFIAPAVHFKGGGWGGSSA